MPRAPEVFRPIALVGEIVAIGVSLISAVLLAKSQWLTPTVTPSGLASTLAILVSGVLYSSMLTVAPATVALASLARTVPLTEVVLVGGLGAMLGDTLIFRFFQSAIFSPIANRVLMHRRKKSRVWRQQRWQLLAVAVGAVIIASPLPDEVGLALIGVTKLPLQWFFPLIYILNSAGILVIALIGR